MMNEIVEFALHDLLGCHSIFGPVSMVKYPQDGDSRRGMFGLGMDTDRNIQLAVTVNILAGKSCNKRLFPTHRGDYVYLLRFEPLDTSIHYTKSGTTKLAFIRAQNHGIAAFSVDLGVINDRLAQTNQQRAHFRGHPLDIKVRSDQLDHAWHFFLSYGWACQYHA